MSCETCGCSCQSDWPDTHKAMFDAIGLVFGFFNSETFEKDPAMAMVAAGEALLGYAYEEWGYFNPACCSEEDVLLDAQLWRERAVASGFSEVMLPQPSLKKQKAEIERKKQLELYAEAMAPRIAQKMIDEATS